MSRTYRKRWNFYPDSDSTTILTHQPDHDCKPDCGLCGDDRASRRQRKVARRQRDKREIGEQRDA